MIRILTALSAAALAAVPAAAATYSAKPLKPAEQRIIAREIVWRCGPAACLAASDSSRPAVICQSLAKRAGPLASFIVDGRAFGPAELALQRLRSSRSVGRARPRPLTAPDFGGARH